jgi:hypothetical protein
MAVGCICCGRRGGLDDRGRPSRSLVAKHRLALPVRPRHDDAFIVDERAECTVGLEGHRSASSLDEFDLGEQAGAVA